MRELLRSLALVAVAASLATSALATRVRLVQGADRTPVVTETSPDGWHDVPDDPARRCITGPHWPLVVPAGVADGATIDVIPESVLEGRVTLADGRPAAGVVLRALPDRRDATCDLSTTSDAQGAFTFRGLPGDLRRVKIITPEGMLAAEDEVAVTLVHGRGRLDVRVHPARRIAVSVSGPTGAVSGASVSVLADWPKFALDPPLGESARKRIEAIDARTDATGSVLLPGLPRRAGWRIVARAPGLSASSTTLDLRGAESPASARLTLAPGGSLRLRAVDVDGMPLPGARARLSSLDAKDADLAPAPKIGGADGIVVAELLPAGKWLIELTARGARPRTVRGVVVKAGETTVVGDVTLQPGAPLAGRVVSAGEPLAGAKVTIDTFADGAKLRLDATTDDAGRFAFEGLDPQARCKVRAALDGYADASKEEVDPGASEVTLELERLASLVVELRAETEPEDVRISVGASRREMRQRTIEAVVDEPNAWRVTGLRPGEVVVSARAAGCALKVVEGLELKAGDEARIEVELEAGRNLAGRVLDADSGQPIEGATVSSQGSEAVSDVDGAFALDGLRSPADVQARHPLRQRARATTVDLDALGSEGLVIRMEMGGSVEGLVKDGAGAPIVGAKISVMAQESLPDAVTDVDGHYRLDGLPPGPSDLTKVDRPGSLDGMETARVAIAKGVVARHDFGAGARLVGRVTIGGEPARGAQLGLVEIVAEDDTTRMPFDCARATARTDADGHYAMTGVVSGEHGLTIRWQGRICGRNVSIAPGAQVTRLDVDLPDLHLAGRVVDAESREPIVGAYVALVCGATPPGQHITWGLGGPDVDESLELSTDPGSNDTSVAGGAFFLLVGETSACKLSSFAHGFESWQSPEPFDVTASRDDVVVELTAESKRGRLEVSLRDAASGEPLSGNLLCAWTSRTSDGGLRESSQSTVGTSSQGFDQPWEGGTATLAAWAPGRGLALRESIAGFEGGRVVTVDLLLAPGGSLRAMVPPDALTASAILGFQGDLHLRMEGGRDLADEDLRNSVSGRSAREVAPGTWQFDDLPPGRLDVSLGDGAVQSVEIVAGQVAEVDLR